MQLIGRFLALALTVSYCYFGYVNVVGPFSLGVIAVFLLVLIFVGLQLIGRRMPIPTLLVFLVVIAALFIWLDAVINGEFRLRSAQQFLTPIAIFFCALGIVYHLNFTKAYLLFFVALLLISSIVAIFQGIGVEMAWDMRYAFPASSDETVESQLRLQAKPAGLSFYAVQLGYQSVLAGCLLLVINSVYSNRHINMVVKYSFVVLLASVAIGRNLSSLLSLIVLLCVYFSMQGRLNFRLRYLFIVIILAIGLVISPIWDRIVTFDASMLSRITFLVVGIILLINNPFGVSVKEMYQAKLDVVNQLFGTGNFPLLEYILETSFHNSFVNIGIQLGWIGFFLYIYLYLKITHIYYLKIKSKITLQSRLGSIGFAFMLGYSIQALSHNAGPLTMDPYFWLANGIIMGLMSAAGNRNKAYGNLFS